VLRIEDWGVASWLEPCGKKNVLAIIDELDKKKPEICFAMCVPKTRSPRVCVDMLIAPVVDHFIQALAERSKG